MVDMKIRVVNKNKEGVTFKVLGLPTYMKGMKQEVGWDEFNDTFDLVPGEKYIYRLNKKSQEEMEAKQEFFTKMMPHMMMMRVAEGKDNGKFLNGLGMLSHFQEEYSEKFGGAPIDFIKEYKEFERAMTERMMSDGIGVGSVHTKYHDFHEDKWPEEKQEKVKKALEPMNKNGSMSLGDMLKGKGIELKD